MGGDSYGRFISLSLNHQPNFLGRHRYEHTQLSTCQCETIQVMGLNEERIPGHVKWPRTQVHYVQVSVGGYSLISYAFQIDVEAGTSNSAALFSGV